MWTEAEQTKKLPRLYVMNKEWSISATLFVLSVLVFQFTPKEMR